MPPEQSGYAKVHLAMERLGIAPEDNPRWGGQRVYRGTEALHPKKAEARASAPLPSLAELPAWLRQPAPAEARPPRPLAPSAQEEDSVPDPPPSLAARAAAERGKWLHALYERLPAVPPSDRRAAADRWLRQAQGVTGHGIRTEINDSALAIIAEAPFGPRFSPPLP